ncbi:hypothetical protein BH10CYA1_BH10CYA1_20800 [soil metagenome]
MIRKSSTFVAAACLCVFGLSSTTNVVRAHSHHETNYVSWGTDEFELFDLTQPELTKQFKGVLEFDKNFETAWLNQNHAGPQFILHFSKGKVATVQRVFIDGGGCHIIGPVLESKKSAAEFSVEGLSKNSKLSQKDQEKLALAKSSLSAGTSHLQKK